MKQTHERKILRLIVHLEPLLLLLKRDGYLDKERVLSPEEFDAVPGPTMLPDDARLIGASCSELEIKLEIESDSFSDALLPEGEIQLGRTKRVHLTYWAKQSGKRELIPAKESEKQP